MFIGNAEVLIAQADSLEALGINPAQPSGCFLYPIFRWVCDSYDGPFCVFGHYELAGIYRICPPEPPCASARMNVSSASVTRGDNVTFSITGAQYATISDWKFVTTQPNVGTVSRDGTGVDWTGIVVATGRAEATVRCGPQTYTVSASVDVRPRPDWVSQPQPAVKVDPPGESNDLIVADPGTGAAGGKNERQWGVTYRGRRFRGHRRRSE